MPLQQELESHRDEVLEIARKHGVTRLLVFGSAARGEAGPESDIDLLVEVGPEHSAWFPGGLIADLESLLGRSVDVVTVEALENRLKDEILEEAVVL